MTTSTLPRTQSSAQRPILNRLVIIGEGFGAKDLLQYWSEAGTLISLDASFEQELPEGWSRLEVREFWDEEQFQRDFLHWLDEFPKQLIDGTTFDQVFRQPTGHSLWWTTVAMERSAHTKLYPSMRLAWCLNQLSKRFELREIAFVSNSREQRELLVRFCEERSITLVGEHPKQEKTYSFPSMIRNLLRPVGALVSAGYCRFGLGIKRPSSAERKRPALIFSSRLNRYFERDGDRIAPKFWLETTEAFSKQAPDYRRYFFVRRFDGFDLKKTAGLIDAGWKLLRKIGGAVPPAEYFPCVGTYLRGLPLQWQAQKVFSRWIHRADFLSSLRFAECDVSGIYLPRIQEAIAGIASWGQQVARLQSLYRWLGNVICLASAEEMYAPTLPELAAAKKEKIFSVGVQHGTVMPMHLTYSLPRGQVENSPLPDQFASYGQYTIDALRDRGHFPLDRFLITGGARFDSLIQNQKDRLSARNALGIDSEVRVILITTQTFAWFTKAVEAILEASRVIGPSLICIKTHPKRHEAQAKQYQQLAERMGIEGVRIFGGDLENLLAASDVVISGSSTSLFEAILIGKKAISVNFSDEPDWYPYVQDGGAYPGNSVAELERAFQKVFDPNEDQSQRNAFLDRHAGPSRHAKGAETFARLVLEEIKRRGECK